MKPIKEPIPASQLRVFGLINIFIIKTISKDKKKYIPISIMNRPNFFKRIPSFGYLFKYTIFFYSNGIPRIFQNWKRPQSTTQQKSTSINNTNVLLQYFFS